MRQVVLASLAGLVLYLLVYFLASCTLDVGQPNISIGCVVLNSPYEHVTYCDGGPVPPPAAHDAGADRE